MYFLTDKEFNYRNYGYETVDLLLQVNCDKIIHDASNTQTQSVSTLVSIKVENEAQYFVTILKHKVNCTNSYTI